MTAPDPVTDPDQYRIRRPPAQSDRCTWLLEQLAAGKWAPGPELLWPEDANWAVHRVVGVYRWEWHNLLLPAACDRISRDPACEWRTVGLPHCPNPRRIPASDRWADYFKEVCLCPPDEPGRPRRIHWVYWLDQREMYCPCGPKDNDEDGIYWGGNEDGYACSACASRLGDHGGRRLVCDCRCCYCGGLARGGAVSVFESGYRLSGHPAMKGDAS